MRLKNSSVIFVLCLSNLNSIAWLFFFLCLEKNMFWSHYTVSDLLASGVVSGKGNLQGGLLALEFGCKISLCTCRHLEIVT